MSEIATGKLVIWMRLQAKRRSIDSLFTPDGNSTSIMLSAAADRLESQEQKIAALTARAEQAEKERDAAIRDIGRLRTKKIELCSICEFEDLIACCHKHCAGYRLFKWRGLP